MIDTLISDPSYSIKTAGTCLYSFAANKGVRGMWNGGCFLIWNHISDIFYKYQEFVSTM